MLPELLPYRDSIDWTDELILKAVKDLECGNISLQEFDSVVVAHERFYKLAALKNDKND